MTFTPFSPYENNVPDDIILPLDPVNLNLTLTDYFRYLIDRINVQEIGIYDTSELINGQVWFNPTDRQNARGAFRMAVDFGALPNASTKSVAHGITTTQDFIFTRFYAVATAPGVTTIIRAIPIPYINTTTPTDSVEMDITDTNVRITTTTASYVGFTKCYVILEYLKNS